MKQDGEDHPILVQSSTVELGEAFPEYARKNVRQVADKYFGRLNSASVHFNRDGATYRCTVNMQMGSLKTMSGEAKNMDIYAAFRQALQKVAKQLRRAKREHREDKAQRVDKDMVLREGMSSGRTRGSSDDYGLAAE